MAVKRMRVFAGPNGSGKTTIFTNILNERKIELGVYVNADDIEKALRDEGMLDFPRFSLTVSDALLKEFFRNSRFAPEKRKEPDLWTRLSVQDNRLTINTPVDAYLAADMAEFIRQQLLEKGLSFTYETVMSHPGKIDFLHQARQQGYRVYLYYIATEDPEININRVRVRIAQQGHAVSPEVVRKRYYNSLSNLKAAVQSTWRAFIFDNSQSEANLIAEITNGTDVTLNEAVVMPGWVAEYLLNSSS